MLVVLEGVDGAGKTSLVDRLTEQSSVETRTLHRAQLKRDPEDEYITDLLGTYTPNTKELLVCDRWHLGELIYGPLYRGKSAVDSGMLMRIERLLDKLGAFRLNVTCDLNTLTRRLAVRGEDYLRAGDVAWVRARYIVLATELGYTELDTTYDDVPKHVIDSILRTARHLTEERLGISWSR